MKYVSFTKGVAFLDYVGYYYRIHPNSAARRYKRDLFFQYETQLKGLEGELCGEEKSHKLVEEALSGLIWRGFNELIYNNNKGWKERKILKEKIFEEPQIWIRENKDKMGRVLPRTAGKIVFLEYILSFILPISVIARLIWLREVLKNAKMEFFSD